jgi:hypothetical protein
MNMQRNRLIEKNSARKFSSKTPNADLLLIACCAPTSSHVLAVDFEAVSQEGHCLRHRSQRGRIDINSVRSVKKQFSSHPELDYGGAAALDAASVDSVFIPVFSFTKLCSATNGFDRCGGGCARSRFVDRLELDCCRCWCTLSSCSRRGCGRARWTSSARIRFHPRDLITIDVHRCRPIPTGGAFVALRNGSQSSQREGRG